MNTSASDPTDPSGHLAWEHTRASELLAGEILLETRPHSIWGGAVTAKMYLPLSRSHVWQQVTDYPRWVQYFPDLIRSEVVHHSDSVSQSSKQIYQVAHKAFLFLSIQVEAYLHVVEQVQQRIQFRLDKGSFNDFSADLKLQDWRNGTMLTYVVQATPAIPMPAAFVQQVMHWDLPTNMKKMRQVICQA